jgi:hypothetical protein
MNPAQPALERSPGVGYLQHLASFLGSFYLILPCNGITAAMSLIVPSWQDEQLIPCKILPMPGASPQCWVLWQLEH